MFDIKDKVVLITGAASGIGACVVRIFLDEGAQHVTIFDIAEENGRALAEELNTKYGCKKVKFIYCDISQENQLLDAFETVTRERGYIDVVMNNAGVFNDKTYVTEIDVNMTALIRSSLKARELMRTDKNGRGGTIINISSLAALVSLPIAPIYSSTKAAVLKFSTDLGDEKQYLMTGVRVLSVCFGLTDTNITRHKVDSFDPVLEEGIFKMLECFKLQSPEHAAKEVAEVYKKGKSASVWIVANEKPAKDATEKYVQSMDLFKEFLFDNEK